MQMQFTRTQLTVFLTMILAVDLLVVTVLIGSQTSPKVGAIALACGIFIPIVIFWLIVPSVAGAMGWWRLRRLYPGVGNPDYRSDAPMISPGLGKPWLGLNNVVEAAPDEDHLHMRIWVPFGKGRMPVSIPWAAVTSIEPFKRRYSTLTLEQGPKLYLPDHLVRAEMALRESLRAAEPSA